MSTILVMPSSLSDQECLVLAEEEEDGGKRTLEEELLAVSEQVMHREVTKVQVDIVRVRLTLREELHMWAQRKIAEDPGATYAITGYVQQCLRNLEANIDHGFALVQEEIGREWRERDSRIRPFCASRS